MPRALGLGGSALHDCLRSVEVLILRYEEDNMRGVLAIRESEVKIILPVVGLFAFVDSYGVEAGGC
jgi:hypothetical protein